MKGLSPASFWQLTELATCHPSGHMAHGKAKDDEVGHLLGESRPVVARTFFVAKEARICLFVSDGMLKTYDDMIYL